MTELGRSKSPKPSAEDFAAFAENLPELAWMADANGWIFWYNRRWYEYTGTTPAEMAGWGWQSVHDPSILPQVLERWKASIATGAAFEMVFPLRGADGVFRPFLTRVNPLRDHQGKVIRWFGTNTDVSEQKATAEALLEEKRLLETLNHSQAIIAAELDLEKLVQTVTDASVTLIGARFGAFFYNVLDEKGESYTLYTISGVPREAFSKFPMPRNTPVFEPTFHGHGIVRSADITQDARYGRNAPYRGMPEGHLPVRSYLAVPVVSRSGEVLGGLFFGHPEPGMFTARHEELLVGMSAQVAVAIDNARLFQAAQREIADRKKAEKLLTTVAAEVDHRAKNMLGLVQAMVRLTSADSLPEYIENLTGRVNALAHAHSLLSESRWNGADLRQIVLDELAPYKRSTLSITIEGPDARLTPAAAQPIAVTLHELTTNAVKYGALSTDQGRLSVSWTLEENGRLELVWRESGGPPVRAPKRAGFGTKAIDRMIRLQLGGELEMDWRESGLACVIRIVLR